MYRKIKKTKLDSSSPLLLTRTSKKLHNKSADVTDSGKVHRYSKINHILIYPLLLSMEPGLYQNNLMHSLRESLTVKKIEFSPPKVGPSVNISTAPLRYRLPKPRLLEKVDSLNAIQRQRVKASSVGDKLYMKKIKKPEKPESPQITPKRTSSFKREYMTPRIPAYTPPIIKSAKPLPKMIFKEAIRNIQWAKKVRPELDKMWRKIINKSYGVEPLMPVKAGYKFYVGKGNNSRLIAKCFTSRSWWVETDNIEEANFSWTQWKNKEYLQKLKLFSNKPIGKIDTINMLLISPVSIATDKNIFRTVDIDDLGFQYIRNSSSYTLLESEELDSSNLIIYNKIEFNQHLANKKGLFKSLKNYYTALNKNVFDYVPLTFHIKNGHNDLELINLESEFKSIEIEKSKTRMQNLWIIKPGENSNRGQGISLASTLEQIKDLISEKIDPLSLKSRTYIIQKYIEKPFLIHKRKFDIRCYSMITSINGIIQGYSYFDGYLRTTSIEYSTKDISNSLIHLTNDAIQKYSEEYGKFEDGNKLSYKDFQRYLDFHCSEKKVNFVRDTVPIIKGLIKDTIEAVYLKIDPKRRLNCMEIFGYDFMLDSNLKPWLIEVNTNPCLELSSGYLTALIPAMVENALRIAVDPLFPPPLGKHNFESFIENKFELIFHQEVDGRKLLEDIGEQKALLLDDEEISDKEDEFPDID